VTKAAVKFWSRGSIDLEEIEKKGMAEVVRRQHCRKCGSREKDCCDGTFKTCKNNHFGRFYTPHALVACPMLHETCTACRQNGQQIEAHAEKDLVQLEQNFRHYQSRGAITSFVYLSLLPESKNLVTSEAWKLGQWQMSLQETPANAYLIGQFKPEIKFDGKAEEERATRINVADFNLRGYPEFQVPANASMQELGTAQTNRIRVIEGRVVKPRKGPEPYSHLWEGAVNSWYENSVTGKYIKYGSKDDKKAIARGERKVGY
jgi:hypothetical protein